MLPAEVRAVAWSNLRLHPARDRWRSAEPERGARAASPRRTSRCASAPSSTHARQSATRLSWMVRRRLGLDAGRESAPEPAVGSQVSARAGQPFRVISRGAARRGPRSRDVEPGRVCPRYPRGWLCAGHSRKPKLHEAPSGRRSATECKQRSSSSGEQRPVVGGGSPELRLVHGLSPGSRALNPTPLISSVTRTVPSGSRVAFGPPATFRCSSHLGEGVGIGPRDEHAPLMPRFGRKLNVRSTPAKYNDAGALIAVVENVRDVTAQHEASGTCACRRQKMG